jgi:hypothetical protein
MRRSHYSYELPGIDWNITIPEKYEKFVIQLYGGASSASLIDGQVFYGAHGGCVTLSLKVQKEDELIIRLGHGGNSKIISESTNVDGNVGEDSYIMLNGNMIAIAYGANGIKDGNGFVEKSEKILGSQISCSGDGGKLYELKQDNVDKFYTDFDGKKACGGKCKKYGNKIIYLGAGGAGYAHVWIDTNELI